MGFYLDFEVLFAMVGMFVCVITPVILLLFARSQWRVVRREDESWTVFPTPEEVHEKSPEDYHVG